MANRPITPADSKAVKRLHAAGKSRNEIARQIKRSQSTVSKLAADQGLSFDRERTAAATAAKSADLAERRVAFAEQLHATAERLHGQLFVPCIVGAFGGKEGDWHQVHLEQPPFADQRQIMSSVSIALDKSLKLQPPKDDNGAEQVGSLLTSLFETLRARHSE